jgi:hypothetical protein
VRCGRPPARAAARGGRERQAREDGGRACALRGPRRDGADGAHAGDRGPSHDRCAGAPPRDGRAGHRRRGAQHQPLLSINPYWYGTDRDVATELIRIQNETLAEICAAHPDRFVAFASVALQHPDLAVEQIEHGVKRYGLRGAGLGGSVEALVVDAPRYAPARAVEKLAEEATPTRPPPADLIECRSTAA